MSVLRSEIICVACDWHQRRTTWTAWKIVEGSPDRVGSDDYCDMLGPISCPKCGPGRLEVRRRWHGEDDPRTRRQAAKGWAPVYLVPHAVT